MRRRRVGGRSRRREKICSNTKIFAMSFRFRAFDEGPHSAARHGTARGGSPGVRARALRGGARGRPERRVHRVQRDDAAGLERHRVSNIRGGHRR